MKHVTLPIEEWIRLIEAGSIMPSRIIPAGSSMWPLIRGGRDVLEVRPFVYDSAQYGEKTTGEKTCSDKADADKKGSTHTAIPAGQDIPPRLHAGDVIVFRRADGAYVVHRIWKISEAAQYMQNTPDGQAATQPDKHRSQAAIMIQTFGDNCRHPDAPVTIDKVCGVVTKIYRNGAKAIHDTEAGIHSGTQGTDVQCGKKGTAAVREIDPGTRSAIIIATISRSLVPVRCRLSHLLPLIRKNEKPQLHSN